MDPMIKYKIWDQPSHGVCCKCHEKSAVTFLVRQKNKDFLFCRSCEADVRCGNWGSGVDFDKKVQCLVCDEMIPVNSLPVFYHFAMEDPNLLWIAFRVCNVRCNTRAEEELASVLKLKEQCVICASCLKRQGTMARCGQCHITRYCSKDCQKKDWVKHKQMCFSKTLS
jgi:hypothetical protein